MIYGCRDMRCPEKTDPETQKVDQLLPKGVGDKED